MAINGLQFTRQRWNPESFTDQNSLATALMTEPEILSKTLAYAFGDKYAIQYLTQGMGRVSNKYTKLGNQQFRWPLMGSLTRAIPITRTAAPASSIGLNFTPFTVGLAEKYFAVGDVIASDSRVLARVQEEPFQDGNDWIYTFRLITNDATATMPAADMAVGKELSFEFTAFEEFSQGGSSKEAFPMWFTNQMTTSRMSYSMSGGAQTDVMVLTVGARNGRGGSRLWLYEKEYQVMLQWMEATERLRWYGKYNRDSQGLVNLPGSNGRPVLMGAGIHDQIATSNRRTYTRGTEKLFREFILDLMDNSRDAENKKFIAFTGKGGLHEFDRAMRDSIASSMIVDTHYVTGSGQELTLGGQFVTYKGLMGTELTLVHLPLYDKKENNRQLHPETQWPLESYNFTVLDFSMYGGESNVSMVAKGTDGIDRSFRTWYTAGSQTPDGGDSGMSKVLRSSSLDGWECHMLSETAIKVTNPLSCGQLVCTAS